MQPTFLIIICLSYLLSMSFFSLYLKKLNYNFLRFGRWLLGLAVALHWGFLVTWLLKRQSFVPSNSFESQYTILALFGFLSWVLSTRKSLIFMVIIVEPLISLGLLLFHFFVFSGPSAELPNPWLWTHILLAILGEAFFIFCALISAVYLLVDFQLRRRIVSPLFSRLPSLVAFDQILGENLLAGFVLMTIGLILGFFFAQEYWEVGWLFDPKVIFAVLTWCFYALLLSMRSKSNIFRGRRSALWAVIGFLIILFLSLGMDRVVPSRHHLSMNKVETRKS